MKDVVTTLLPQIDVRLTRLVISYFGIISASFVFRRLDVYSKLYTNSPCSYTTKYFLLTCFGIIIGCYNFGPDFTRSLLTVLSVYMTFCFTSSASVILFLTIVISMGHLLYGFWLNLLLSEEYHYNWTLPHTVLTLKLIAVAFDYYDGQFDPKEVNDVKVQPKLWTSNANFLEKKPSLMQLFAHSYFPASVIGGPQFSLRHTVKTVEDKLEVSDYDIITEAAPSFTRGLVLLLVAALASIFFPITNLSNGNFMTNKNIWINPFIYFLISIFGRCAVYIFIWSWAESGCLVFGVGGQEDKKFLNNANWTNVYLGLTLYQRFIQGFNIQVNRWCSLYIAKRLNGLSPVMKQFIVSALMCLWHGFDFGYLPCFTIVFFSLVIEGGLVSQVERSTALKKLHDENKIISYSFAIIYRILTAILFCSGVAGICCLDFESYRTALSGTQFCVIPVLGLMFVVSCILSMSK